MRKRIAGILPYSVAPEIQPCVRLIKVIVRLHEALGDVSGQAQEAIARGGIDSLSAHTGFTGALDHPILDLISKFLCFGIQFIIYVAQLDQLVHHLQGLVPVLDAQNALEPYDTACP